MKSNNFSCSMTAHVTAKEAIEGISNVAGWWASKVNGNSTHQGDVFTVLFGKTFSTIRISELIPGKKILWEVIDSLVPLFKNEKQWNGTKMLWEIAAEGDTTRITFTHIGLTPETECYTDCEAGWSFFIKESLLKLLTEKQGLPRTGITTYIFSDDRKYDGLLYYKNDPLPDYPKGHIFLDVKETQGEQVTAIYAAGDFDSENFDAQSLKGEYFMVIENKPVFGGIVPLEDILLQ